MKESGRTIAVVPRRENRRMFPGRYFVRRLVRDDALGVGPVIGGRVEVQASHVPVEIQQVLELERDLLR
jgi:hypothetical protein